jgi:hypothetical protein
MNSPYSFDYGSMDNNTLFNAVPDVHRYLGKTANDNFKAATTSPASTGKGILGSLFGGAAGNTPGGSVSPATGATGAGASGGIFGELGGVGGILGGLGTLGNLWMTFKGLGMMDDMFDFQKNMAEKNYQGNRAAYMNSMNDQITEKRALSAQPHYTAADFNYQAPPA